MFFGLLGFIFNTYLIPFSVITLNKELPISNIQGIIEKNEKIYIGLGAYNRIQIYNSKGEFIEYIKTSNHSKAYDFIVDSNGNPITNVIFTREKSIKKFIQEDGSEYIIKSTFPLIIEKNNSQGKHVKIKQPLHMSFWGGSINCWLIGLIGGFLFFITNSNIIMEVQGLKISKEARSKEILRRIFK